MFITIEIEKEEYSQDGGILIAKNSYKNYKKKEVKKIFLKSDKEVESAVKKSIERITKKPFNEDWAESRATDKYSILYHFPDAKKNTHTMYFITVYKNNIDKIVFPEYFLNLQKGENVA